MKSKKFLYLAVPLASVLIQTIHASPLEPLPEKIIKLCNSGYTQDLNACAAYQYKQSIREQKEAYKKAMLKAVKSDKIGKDLGIKDEVTNVRLLKLSQKHWESYQKDYCRSIGNTYSGGTMQEMEIINCRGSLVSMRTKMLNSQFPLGDPGG